MFMRIAISALGIAAVSTPTQPGQLVVTVDGVRSAEGGVMASLLRAGADGKPQIADGTVLAARKGKLSLIFADLAPGQYAVELFHDENGNGKLDKTPFSLPAEGVAFSNGATAQYGHPAFAAMAVDVGAAPASTAAPMIYPVR